MILTTDELRKVRPIAENINDLSRLEPYVREAETLTIVDAIGADLYRWLDENIKGSTDLTYVRPDGKSIELSPEEFLTIFNGGYYVSSCCDCRSNTRKTEGLNIAIAYLAYSRFIMNNGVNPTAYGVKFKDSDFSTSVEFAALNRASSEAKKLGEAYLTKEIEHLQALGLLGDCGCKCNERHIPADNLVIKRKKV